MNFSLVKGVMVAQQPRGCENSMIYLHSKEIVFNSYVFNDKKQGAITHRMLKTETAFTFHAKREDYTTENYCKMREFNYFNLSNA